MPKGATVAGRFPVPLRGSVPSEADMLKELESLKGVYGSINERMREWLMRGLKELEHRTQQVPSAGGDATRALVAVAQELTSSVAISQHILTMYAQAKETLAMAPRPRSAPAQAAAASPPVPVSPASEASPAPAATAATEPMASTETPPEATDPTKRWGHLKGLVGG